MAVFCLPKHLVKKISDSLSGDGLIKLYDMSVKDRAEFFAKQTNKDIGAFLSKEFNKAIVSKKKTALNDFVNLIAGDIEPTKRKDLMTKIKELTDDELLTPESENKMLEVFVGDALGTHITPKEAGEIFKLGKAREATQTNLTGKTVVKDGKINQEFKKALIEDYKAVKAMDDYLIKHTKNDWVDTLKNHLKSFMLLSPKSVAVNIISNVEKSFFDRGVKRISTGKMSGYNGDLAKEMADMMYEISQVTHETIVGKKIGAGYDLSRALSLDDMMQKNMLGEKIGVGKDTKVTRFVYETLLGRADYRSSRIAFVDTLNLLSSKWADDAGLKGAEAKKFSADLMADAFELSPTTKKGQELRAQAVQDAMLATWTNKGKISETMLNLRQGINKTLKEVPVIGRIGIGDFIERFVKTNANIIGFGLDASGGGFIKSLHKFNELRKIKGLISEAEAKSKFRDATKDLMITVGGFGAAMIISSMLDDDDFIGSYDPARTKYDELRGNSSNVIRIGNRWVSLDYLIPAMPLVGIMYAKKYGNGNSADMVFSYLKGIGDQASKAPFVSTLFNMAKEVQKKLGEGASKEDFAKYMGMSLFDQVIASVPGFMSDMAQIVDKNRRDTSTFKGKVYSRIPWLSKQLDKKLNMFGEEVKTEVGQAKTPFQYFLAVTSQLLAGARVKQVKGDKIDNEIIRLQESGNAVTITDWTYRPPKKLIVLKEKVGKDKYNSLFSEFGVKLKEQFKITMETDNYKTADDTKKDKILSKVEDNVLNELLKQYE